MTRNRNRAARRRAWRYGRLAEMVSAALLRLKGYRILEHRHRNPFGEIDLIARRGSVIAFVEVKARENLATAAEAVGSRQRRRVERAAEAYLAHHPDFAALSQRFDVILIGFRALPHHMPDAWRPESER